MRQRILTITAFLLVMAALGLAWPKTAQAQVETPAPPDFSISIESDKSEYEVGQTGNIILTLNVRQPLTGSVIVCITQFGSISSDPSVLAASETVPGICPGRGYQFDSGLPVGPNSVSWLEKFDSVGDFSFYAEVNPEFTGGDTSPEGHSTSISISVVEPKKILLSLPEDITVTVGTTVTVDLTIDVQKTLTESVNICYVLLVYGSPQAAAFNQDCSTHLIWLTLQPGEEGRVTVTREIKKNNGQPLFPERFWLFAWVEGAEERPETIVSMIITVLPKPISIFLPLIAR